MKYIIAIISIMTLSSTVLFAEEIFKTKQQSWPKTCIEAGSYIIGKLDDSYIKNIETTKFRKLRRINDELGGTIQSYTGLWDGNDELILSCLERDPEKSPAPNSVSLLIIEEAWRIMHKDELDEKKRKEAEAIKAREDKRIQGKEEAKRIKELRNKVETSEDIKLQRRKDAEILLKKMNEEEEKLKEKKKNNKDINSLYNIYGNRNVK